MRRRFAGRGELSYPRTRAALDFIEPWMPAAAALFAVIAGVVRYFQPFGLFWLVVIPALVLVALAGLRAKRNAARHRQRRGAYMDRARRELRYSALTKPGREAVDKLREERQNIIESSALNGQQLSDMLARLDGYEGDYIDLLYIYQERARRLKAITGRNLSEERRALEEERSSVKEGDRGRQLLDALGQHETLLRRQEEVGAEIESSLPLIRRQALNIQAMFALISDQVSTLPLGVAWSSGAEFETLSEAIEMTKQSLESAERIGLTAGRG